MASLLRVGVLKSSDLGARPPPELRELVWYRQSLIQARSTDVNRVQQGLAGADITRSQLVREVWGTYPIARREAASPRMAGDHLVDRGRQPRRRACGEVLTMTLVKLPQLP